jgi:hypothetical protein
MGFMSPRLIAIFAGLILVTLALVAFFFWRGGDVQSIPTEISSILKGSKDDIPKDRRVVKQGPLLPTFDIVRVDSSGTAVIAGRGEPGGTITVLANGEPVATAEIDQQRADP